MVNISKYCSFTDRFGFAIERLQWIQLISSFGEEATHVHLAEFGEGIQFSKGVKRKRVNEQTKHSAYFFFANFQ